MESIQGKDWQKPDEINKYFNLDLQKGVCLATTKVFKNIDKGLKNINEPINQFLNEVSRYCFKSCDIYTIQEKEKNSYCLFELSGGWTYSPGIFILKYGEEQPLFLNWRKSPF